MCHSVYNYFLNQWSVYTAYAQGLDLTRLYSFHFHTCLFLPSRENACALYSVDDICCRVYDVHVYFYLAEKIHCALYYFDVRSQVCLVLENMC